MCVCVVSKVVWIVESLRNVRVWLAQKVPIVDTAFYRKIINNANKQI